MSQSRPIPSSERQPWQIALRPKQANIFVWGWQSTARFRFAVCGRRFGKTYLAAKEIQRAYRLARERKVDPDNEIWYGAPTQKQAKRVFWRRIKRAIPRDWIDGKPNETELTIPLKGGYLIRLVGLDGYDSLRGSGLWFFVGDEWADCPAAAWDEVLEPMLATAGGHALFIGTPKGFNHFYDGYVAGQPGFLPPTGEDGVSASSWDPAVTRSWQYTSLQGGNIPEAELARSRATKDPRIFRQENEATFESFAGRVYYAFSRPETVRPCPYDPELPLHVGMDFNVNPMSATVWQEHGDEIWQVDEILIPTSDTHEMAKELAARYGRESFLPGKVEVAHITVYPDPAGAQRRTSAQGKTDISILRDQGFKVMAMSSHPLVRDRINAVNAKFLAADGKRRAFVDPRNRVSIECYERQCFKEGTNDPDKSEGLDHVPDATGYYIFGRFVYNPAHAAQLNHQAR